MKHTPGPWIVKENKTKYDDLFEYDIIQAQPDPEYDRILSVVFNIDSKANAQLIAAAPDLLEALKHLKNLMESTSDLTELGDLVYCDSPIFITAIAKAEGR